MPLLANNAAEARIAACVIFLYAYTALIITFSVICNYVYYLLAA